MGTQISPRLVLCRVGTELLCWKRAHFRGYPAFPFCPAFLIDLRVPRFTLRPPRLPHAL